MKDKRVKTITIVGLLSVFLLQFLWASNVFELTITEFQRKGGKALYHALVEDVTRRIRTVPIPNEGVLDNMKNGTELDSGFLNEIFTTLNAPMSMHFIDSTYKSLALEEKMDTLVSIELISDSLGVIQSTRADKGFWHLTCPEKVHTKEDKSEYLQVSILNPHKGLFVQMGLLFVATIIITFVVVYCISYQIKVINKQNRIAQLRRDFSNAMIHDMRSPLTSIIQGNRNLASGKLDELKAKRFHKIIHDEAEKLLTLADRVLVLSKLEQEALVLAREVIGIKKVIDDIIEKLSVKTDKEIKFITNYHAEEVYGDPEYIEQIITNLIDNSIKYSGKCVTVEVTVEENEQITKISVKDNGFGIPHKDQIKIFEKFERAAASRRSSKGGATGFGVGLNFVQQIVKAHGGTVDIESIEGQYSEFTINIPKLKEGIYD